MLLIYFGWPTAAEDNAERAVAAGLTAVERVQELAVCPGPLQVRVGIATGLAVVGDLIGTGVAQEESVIGEVPNLAARLQSIAPPGSVVISAITRRLIGAQFEVEALGSTQLSGSDAAVQAWRVMGENRSAIRFTAVRAVQQVVGYRKFTGRSARIFSTVRP